MEQQWKSKTVGNLCTSSLFLDWMLKEILSGIIFILHWSAAD